MKTWKNIGILAVSALSLGVIACSGSDGAPGAKGDTGAKGDPGDGSPASVGVVVPSIGLLDRELDVTITANGVDFTAAAPTVDLGTGVTVSNIQALSATTIFAHLKIDATAATGARDVKVTSGTNNLTAKGAFKVAEAIDFEVKQGKAEQGGAIYYTVDNLDTQHAFDPNAFALASDSGLDLLGQNIGVTATHAEGVLLIAPGASATGTVVAEDDDALGEPYATFGATFPIASRSATSATAGTPLTGQSISAPFGTQLYKYSTAAAGIWEVTTTDPGAKITPTVAVFGTDGSVASAFNGAGGASVVYPTTAASQSNVAVVLDSGLGGGSAADYGFTFTVVNHTGTIYAEPAGAHDTLAHATTNSVKVPSLPLATTNNGDIITGSLSSAMENDWYGVDIAANDALEIAVTGSDGTQVDLTDNAGTSELFLDDPLFGFDARPTIGAAHKAPSTTVSTDANGDPLPAGTFYIHVTGGTGAYSISLRRRASS